MGKRDATRTKLHWALLNHWTTASCTTKRLDRYFALQKIEEPADNENRYGLPEIKKAGGNLGSPYRGTG